MHGATMKITMGIWSSTCQVMFLEVVAPYSLVDETFTLSCSGRIIACYILNMTCIHSGFYDILPLEFLTNIS